MKPESMDLAGDWQLRWNDGERGERPGRVLAGEVDWSRAWSASVPGSVHETLVAHGVIPEPNIGTNVLSCRWVEETIWYYRREFPLPWPREGARFWLVFESLDLAARIFLNGKEVGSHQNAFYPARLDVTHALREGNNELVVEIESGLFSAMHRSAEGFGLRKNHQLTKAPWLRKTQSQHGWDWAPRLLNVGIPGGVRLEKTGDCRWESLSVSSELAPDRSQGKIHVRVLAENLSPEPVPVLFLAGLENHPVQEVQTLLEPGAHRLEMTLVVEHPELWWPVGRGPRNRYRVTAELRTQDVTLGKESRAIGFRHVRIDQSPHPEGGRYFVVEVNGERIFCKGANYVPQDLILSRVDRSRHAALVERALEANCNFLRVWGGGVYESHDFYEMCDEKGILVWQDFVFACCKYPATDEHFLADVKREVAHQIRRLAHHPSLIVWCGNNEMEWGAWSWGFEKGVSHPDYALFHLEIPRILQTEDPSRYYQPSSPFSPDGRHPNDDLSGDQHPWSVGFGDTDFRNFRQMKCRFPNEGGILGPNSLPTVLQCLEGGPLQHGTFAWELHDNSLSAWDEIPAYSPDRMLQLWLGCTPRELTIPEYVYWAGVVHGLGLAEYIKNFRRRMFDSAAAVFWMFNDIWPCTRSWTIVDCEARRTPAFHPVRRAFAPVALCVVREDDLIRVFGVNDGPEISGSLRCGVLAVAGGIPLDFSRHVTLPKNQSTILAEFSAKEWDALGVATHLAFGVLSTAEGEIARDCLMLPLFQEMQWVESEIRVEISDGMAVFSSDRFVPRVCLDLEGALPLPDNFFDLYPGIPTALPWSEALGVPSIRHFPRPSGGSTPPASK